MSFSSRVLDQKAFHKYAEKEYAYKRLPGDDAFVLWAPGTSTLTVRGFNEDAEDVLDLRTGAGDSKLEITWSSWDRVSYIVRRLEEKLRVQKEHWFLAADGRELQGDTVVCNSLAFSGPNPELVLVPKSAADAFKQSGRPRARGTIRTAKALFGLIEPLGSNDTREWTAYTERRIRDTARFQALLARLDGDCEACLPDAMLEQIREGTIRAIAATGLEGAEARAAEKAVLPQKVSLEGDGDVEVQSADVTTRIFGLRKPGAVDVMLSLWSKPRYYSVEWSIGVSYRIHETAPQDDAGEGKMRRLLSGDLENDDRSGRLERWNPREVKKFGMRGADVRAVRRVLFGDAAPVSLVDTVRLLLASIGICIDLEGGESSESDDEDEDQDQDDDDDDEEDEDENEDDFVWFQDVAQYSLFDPRWLGVHIRRACSAAIPSDADFVDRGAEPRYEEDDLEEDDEGGFLEDSDEDTYSPGRGYCTRASHYRVTCHRPLAAR